MEHIPSFPSESDAVNKGNRAIGNRTAKAVMRKTMIIKLRECGQNAHQIAVVTVFRVQERSHLARQRWQRSSEHLVRHLGLSKTLAFLRGKNRIVEALYVRASSYRNSRTTFEVQTKFKNSAAKPNLDAGSRMDMCIVFL